METSVIAMVGAIIISILAIAYFAISDARFRREFEAAKAEQVAVALAIRRSEEAAREEQEAARRKEAERAKIDEAVLDVLSGRQKPDILEKYGIGSSKSSNLLFQENPSSIFKEGWLRQETPERTKAQEMMRLAALLIEAGQQSKKNNDG